MPISLICEMLFSYMLENPSIQRYFERSNNATGADNQQERLRLNGESSETKR